MTATKEIREAYEKSWAEEQKISRAYENAVVRRTKLGVATSLATQRDQNEPEDREERWAWQALDTAVESILEGVNIT